MKKQKTQKPVPGNSLRVLDKVFRRMPCALLSHFYVTHRVMPSEASLAARSEERRLFPQATPFGMISQFFLSIFAKIKSWVKQSGYVYVA